MSFVKPNKCMVSLSGAPKCLHEQSCGTLVYKAKGPYVKRTVCGSVKCEGDGCGCD